MEALRVQDGDAGFTGVNERIAPDKLPPTVASRAVNLRFRTGEARTRGGIGIRHIGLDDGWTPLPSPAAATVYRTPDNQEWFIIQANGTTYRSQPNLQAVEITQPGSTTWPASTRFVQAGDNLYALRGEDYAVLELMDGDFDTGWREVTQETSGSGNGTGTLTIPNASRGMYFQERLWLVTREGLYVSDVRNFTRYSLLNVFRIESGAQDELLAVAPFGSNSLVAFKSRSVHGRYNLIPDDNGDLTPAFGDVISSTNGILAPEAVVQVGADLFYLAENGLTSVRLTEENRLKAIETPLTQDMARTWSRINWSQIRLARIAWWDSRIYLAVPLDGASYANHVMVWDAQTRTWNGYDAGPALAFGVTDWMIARYAGEPRLFFLDGQGIVRLYECPDAEDATYGVLLSEVERTPLTAEGSKVPLVAEVPEYALEAIRTRLTTRGYTMGTNDWKRYACAEVSIETQNASVRFTGTTDGVREEFTLLPDLVPDRTRYTTWGGGVYNETNSGDNFENRHREDYTWVPPADGTLLHTGFRLGLMQDWSVTRRWGERGRFAQLVVANTRGRARLKGAMVKGMTRGEGKRERT